MSDLHFLPGVVLVVMVLAVLSDVADTDCAEGITDEGIVFVAMDTDDTVTFGSDAARCDIPCHA